MKVSKTEVEKHRAFWAKIAKANNWYTKPFHIQVWVDKDGNVTDSVSHVDLTKDIVIEE